MTSLGGRFSGTGIYAGRSQLSHYVEELGKVIGNLQSLELILRFYLLKHEGAPMLSSHLDTVTVGDVVPKNALTDYRSLGQLLDAYNERVGPQDALQAEEIVRLRDALAHGRLLARQPGPPFRLLKFSDPKKGPIKIEIDESIDRSWLATKKALVNTAMEKVGSGSWRNDR